MITFSCFGGNIGTVVLPTIFLFKDKTISVVWLRWYVSYTPKKTIEDRTKNVG